MSLATDLETIEALDFEYTPPCESLGHGRGYRSHDGGGAYALVRVEMSCGHCFEKYYCKVFTQRLTGASARPQCHICWTDVHVVSAVILAYVGAQ